MTALLSRESEFPGFDQGALGADVVELHVYGDNTPAVRLYRGLGFSPVAETMMMHQLRFG